MKTPLSYTDLEPLKERIETTIKNTLQRNGTPLYFRTTDLKIQNGDESSIHTIIWTANTPYPIAEMLGNKEMQKIDELEDAFYETDSELMCDLAEITGNDGLEGTPDKGFLLTNTGDYLMLRTSDAHIYLTIYYSGQY